MPLYTYTCTDHGEFSAWEAMSQSDQPQPCPSCREPATRALARPAVGGRSGADGGGFGGGEGGMCMSQTAAAMGGCCGGGRCVH